MVRPKIVIENSRIIDNIVTALLGYVDDVLCMVLQEQPG